MIEGYGTLLVMSARADSSWQVELLDKASLPEGNLIMLPCPGNALAIAQESHVAEVVGMIVVNVFGGYDPMNRSHIILRSWLYGNAHSIDWHDAQSFILPEGLRSHVENREDLTLLVQVECEEKPRAVMWGSHRASPERHGWAPLPERFVLMLGDEPVVFASLANDSIWAFPGVSAFRAYIDSVFVAKFGGFNQESTEQVQLRSFLSKSSELSAIDREYALYIPDQLADKVLLEDGFVAVGVEDHVEVYPAKRWGMLCEMLVGSFANKS